MWLRENWATGLLAYLAQKKKYQLGRVAKVKMSKQLHHSVTNLFRFAQQQLKRES